MLLTAFLLNFLLVTGRGVAQTAGQELPERQTLPCGPEAPNSVKSRRKGGKIT
jgi:hypothetical protein